MVVFIILKRVGIVLEKKCCCFCGGGGLEKITKLFLGVFKEFSFSLHFLSLSKTYGRKYK